MSDSGENGTDERVVIIEQRLLKIDEVFIYRIPPMRSADGHRAEDWNLAKPLATCSLLVARRDNDLCVNLMAERPKPGAPAGAIENYLFAQSTIHVDFTNPSHNIEHWVNPVVDSSRYFALRIEDSKSGREAFIGVGFRERTDATNFRMTIEGELIASDSCHELIQCCSIPILILAMLLGRLHQFPETRGEGSGASQAI